MIYFNDRILLEITKIYAFYKELGIVNSNPFKASAGSIPSDDSRSYCDAMDMDQLKQVYVAIQDLKKQGVDIEIPVKTLLFTGLRNEGICSLTGKDIDFQENLIVYNSTYSSFHCQINLQQRLRNLRKRIS